MSERHWKKIQSHTRSTQVQVTPGTHTFQADLTVGEGGNFSLENYIFSWKEIYVYNVVTSQTDSNFDDRMTRQMWKTLYPNPDILDLG